ncbi:MAG: hypothetical protein DRG83_18240 [Deltaproteobacteria bacterium]|nr:MAG: hypothetical protein DRG83_18240 [Deltaproteobacteria bacterium]
MVEKKKRFDLSQQEFNRMWSIVDRFHIGEPNRSSCECGPTVKIGHNWFCSKLVVSFKDDNVKVELTIDKIYSVREDRCENKVRSILAVVGPTKEIVHKTWDEIMRCCGASRKENGSSRVFLNR